MKKNFIKVIGFSLLSVLLSVALCIAIGKGIFYYNYNLAPPAKLMKKIKIGQSYHEVYALFHQYQKEYINNPSVSVDIGETDRRTAEALEISQGKYLFIYHDSFTDDLQLTVYFDNNDKVVRIIYVGD
jgi:hypothetical protein